MNDRVLHNRLQDQLGNDTTHQILRNLTFVRKGISEPEFLNIAVIFDHVQLFGERNKLAVRDTLAQENGKILRKPRHLRNLMIYADPLDGIERIVKKMRIQLRLQHPDFCLIQLLLLANLFFYVFAQTYCRFVESFCKKPQLIIAVHMHLRIHVAVPEASHRGTEFCNRPGQIPGHIICKQKSQRHHQNTEEQNNIQQRMKDPRR